jgi:hypothetical protein
LFQSLRHSLTLSRNRIFVRLTAKQKSVKAGVRAANWLFVFSVR